MAVDRTRLRKLVARLPAKELPAAESFLKFLIAVSSPETPPAKKKRKRARRKT